MYASPRQRCPITNQREVGINASSVRVMFFKMSIFAVSVRLGLAASDAMELGGMFGLATSQVSAMMAGGNPRDARLPGNTEDDTEAARRDMADIFADRYAG